MTKDDLGLPPGWYVDPLGPLGRRRWWSDGAWTARVAGPDDAPEGIAWTPELAGAPSPPVAPPVPKVPDVPEVPKTAAAPVVPATPEVPATTYAPKMLAALPAEIDVHAALAPARAAAAADPVVEPAPTRRRGRRLVGALAVAAVLASVGIAGADGLPSGGEAPTIAPVTVFRDSGDGFALRYPDGWAPMQRLTGTVTFTVGPEPADEFDRNTVSVDVRAGVTLPTTLDALAQEATTRLRQQFPGIRLDAANETQLAGSPAYRLDLTDTDKDPDVRIVKVAGTTDDGEQLVVTVTIRDPQTAPTPARLRAFLDSIQSV